MNKNEQTIIIVVIASLTILGGLITYCYINDISLGIFGREPVVNHAYANVTLVEPANYAYVDLPVTATVHVVTNATNPLIQFTFKHVENGYDYYYRSIRFSIANNTDISYTPTFNESLSDTSFTWYVSVYNGSKPAWSNENNVWHFTTNKLPDKPPVADAGGPYMGGVGTPITLDASGSIDPDGNIVSYRWDTDGDGIYDETGKSVQATYTFTGNYTITLEVTDNDGITSTDTTYAVITSTPPAPTQTHNSQNDYLIVIIAFSSILAIAGYILYRRMKERR